MVESSQLFWIRSAEYLSTGGGVKPPRSENLYLREPAYTPSPDGDGRFARTGLHLFCKERIPPFMITSDIVALPCLPKSRAGKVIKRHLKAL